MRVGWFHGSVSGPVCQCCAHRSYWLAHANELSKVMNSVKVMSAIVIQLSLANLCLITIIMYAQGFVDHPEWRGHIAHPIRPSRVEGAHNPSVSDKSKQCAINSNILCTSRPILLGLLNIAASRYIVL